MRNWLVIPVSCALLYGCVGPPVGSLILSVPAMSGLDPVGALGVAAFFSYLYGIVPAWITGFLCGHFVRANAFLLWIGSGLIGAGTSFLFYKLVAADYLFSMDVALYRMALPGFLGGLVCGALAAIASRAYFSQEQSR